MRDTYGRNIDYMRISITDRCNLSCNYCKPPSARPCTSRPHLNLDEFDIICTEAMALDITKFKITGGEPLLNTDCIGLIQRLKSKGAYVSLTTNGILLSDYIDALHKSKIDAINISLDSLNPDTYSKITGSDELPKVLDSIYFALLQDIPIKVNCVLQTGVNENDWIELLELSRNHPIHVRFIELMPIGYAKVLNGFDNKSLLSQIIKLYGPLEPGYIYGNGPATYYHVPGFCGMTGFISAIHSPFCSHCNRIRLSATGFIKPCLSYGEGYDVYDAAKAKCRESLRHILQEAILSKPCSHLFNAPDEITESKGMSYIGG